MSERIMTKVERCVLVASSFVPVLAAWLSSRRYAEFVSSFQSVLCLDSIFTRRTAFVVGTIQFWPYCAVLGWLLLVPSMRNKAWAHKFRIVTMCFYLVIGPVLYAICLDGLFAPTLSVAKSALQRVGPATSDVEMGIGRMGLESRGKK